MSLFKARDWWSTKVGDDEEFDLGCMVVGSLCNSSSSEEQTGMKTPSCNMMLLT